MSSETALSGSLAVAATKWGAIVGGLVLAATSPQLASAAAPISANDLDRLSIEDLAKIDVSSVTKTTQPLSDAPGSIYVITHDDIVRSGATSLPEILRLAPNLQIYQTSASQYVITARGFNGSSADQNFSDKLLVLIDGRSVYTPLYSGVYWDMQAVLPEDIDHIEVISGPGATLWGANAVNGVINIITKKSAETQGGLVDVSAGNLQTSIGVRYGGRIGDSLAYRVYFNDVIDGQTRTSSGAPAHDGWSKPQGGFRFDWTPSPADTVSLQGDGYAGSEDQLGAPNQDISGGDLVARWNHAFADGSALQVQAYYDRAGRTTEDNGGDFHVDTFDIDLQDSFTLDRHNQIVWGGGLRVSRYDITGTPSLFFAPSKSSLLLSNVFVQDSISFSDPFKLILGLKLEDDPYSGLSVLPSARLSWKPSEALLIWAAVSRAIRSPTPFDQTLREFLGPTLFLVGSPDFQPEKLTAYEIGARAQPTSRLSFSVSAFYNVYDDLRSIEFDPVTLIPLRFGNGLRGDTYGVEAWGDYRATSWWRLSAGLSTLFERFNFKPGASGLLGIQQLGDDPSYQASLKSSMNLGRDVTLDADLRYVSALPDPFVPAYLELNARVGWNVSDRVRLSLSGFNLLHDRHQELPAPADPVSRSVQAGLQWRF